MRDKYFSRITIGRDAFDEGLEIKFSNPGMHSVVTLGPDDLDALADLASEMRSLAQEKRDETARASKMDVRYPEVTVALTGTNGNIFTIMGRVGSALRKAGVPRGIQDEFWSDVDEFWRDVAGFSYQDSYSESLQTVTRWVNVE